MEHEVISFEIRRIEKSLSQLGAKVADAQVLLVEVQQEIEALYLSLHEADEITPRNHCSYRGFSVFRGDTEI